MCCWSLCHENLQEEAEKGLSMISSLHNPSSLPTLLQLRKWHDLWLCKATCYNVAQRELRKGPCSTADEYIAQYCTTQGQVASVALDSLDFLDLPHPFSLFSRSTMFSLMVAKNDHVGALQDVVCGWRELTPSGDTEAGAGAGGRYCG